MQQRNIILQVIGIVLVILVLVGCSEQTKPPSSTSTPSQVTTPGSSTDTSQPTSPPQTSSTGTPVPGQWQADGNELGPFEFTVSSDSSTITGVSFHIDNMKCGTSGNVSVSAPISGSWDVSNGQMKLSAKLSPTVPNIVPNPVPSANATIVGTFDQTGKHATGTWELALPGNACSGTWTGNSAS
jgi:hypothetical protein